MADYITLNISSPNTKNLRDLQSVSNMESFLDSIKILHNNLKKVYKKHTPLVVKIAPDIEEEPLNDLLNLVNSYDIDGIICTNTTILKQLIEFTQYVYDQQSNTSQQGNAQSTSQPGEDAYGKWKPE